MLSLSPYELSVPGVQTTELPPHYKEEGFSFMTFSTHQTNLVTTGYFHNLKIYDETEKQTMRARLEITSPIFENHKHFTNFISFHFSAIKP